jgi:hypothetical protein
MTDTITVHCITNNMKGSRPRQPLVQVIANDECGTVQSITLHPKHAEAFAKAILVAGEAATEGRHLAAQTIQLR